MPKVRKSSKKADQKSPCERRERNKHLGTPQRAKIQGALEYCHAKGIPVDDRDIFDFFGVSYSTGYRLAHQPSRTFHTRSDVNETRTR